MAGTTAPKPGCGAFGGGSQGAGTGGKALVIWERTFQSDVTRGMNGGLFLHRMGDKGMNAKRNMSQRISWGGSFRIVGLAVTKRGGQSRAKEKPIHRREEVSTGCRIIGQNAKEDKGLESLETSQGTKSHQVRKDPKQEKKKEGKRKMCVETSSNRIKKSERWGQKKKGGNRLVTGSARGDSYVGVSS